MTKKHFIALANVIIAARRRHPDQFRNGEIIELAEFCRSQNSGFKSRRWYDYIAGECGPSGGKIKETA